LFAGVVVAPSVSGAGGARVVRDMVSAVDEENDEDIDDDGIDAAIVNMVVSTNPVVAAQNLRSLLEHMTPFDATRTAMTAAVSPNVDVRRALAAALVWPFRLVGETFVLEQLMDDPDPDVRVAALAAAHIRYP
jgi:hypothetical protein